MPLDQPEKTDAMATHQQDETASDFWNWFGTWEQIVRIQSLCLFNGIWFLRNDGQDFVLSDENRREIIEAVFRIASNLDMSWSIISDYLRLKHGRQKIELEPVHLDEVITQVGNSLEKNGSNVQITTSDDLPKIKGNSMWLERAILGCIADLSYQGRPFEQKLVHTFSAEITDNGFVLFRINTTKSQKEQVLWGAGIGADMAQLVIEQFGGQMTLDGNSDKTKVSIILLPWKDE